MDIHEVRTLLKTKSVFDIPLRVTFYARVSSESDEQINSLDNQVAYYRDFIGKNPHWAFHPGYIDEGISGISTKKRENFNQMIADAEDGQFDLIITKEISRFARNTLDSIQFTRRLLAAGVGVFFQNDNINTFDDDSELRLSIMSSIAQDELRKLSSRIKFGHQQAIKSGVVLGNSRVFGYTKNDGRLVIDPEQAEMVRELFELYATDRYSMKQIEQIFYDKGYRNNNGKRIMHNTLSGIISNPKYKGYYVGNKVKVVDMFTKKQKFLPPEEWVMFKDESGEIVPAIVSEEIWDRANVILSRRSEDVKARKGVCNHPNLLTGKLFCAHCGKAYYRRSSQYKDGRKNNVWVCSGKINNGAGSCPSFPIYEEELKPILIDVFRETKVDVEALIEEYMKMYESILGGCDIEAEIESCESRKKIAIQKQAKLLEYNVTGKISDADFLRQNKRCDEEISRLDTRIEELRENALSGDEIRKHVEAVRDALRAAAESASQSIIDKSFVDKYIDSIYATPIDSHSMSLEIKILTGETSSRSIRRKDLRPGQMNKKICPERSFSVTRNSRTLQGYCNHLVLYAALTI